MLKRLAVYVSLLLSVAFLLACNSSKSTPSQKPAPEKAAPKSPGPSAAAAKGIAVSKEILDTFDQAVAAAAALMKDKPEPADLKPKLQALFQQYEAKMKDIGVRYKALKADPEAWGAANSYMDENRGKHVAQKDNTLSAYLRYYNLEKGDKEVVKLLSDDIVHMIDVAVQR